MKLTKQTIERLQLPAGKTEAIFFDEGLPCFGLRIRAGGKRTWVVQYRLGKKQRRITLGTVELLDPDNARRRAKTALAKVHLGTDAQLEKSEARAQASVTFANVAQDYLKRYAATRLKPSTYRDTERYLRVHWKEFARMPLQKITRADVAAGIAKIAQESGGVAANRARTALGGLFGWAIAEGLVEANPVSGTRKAVDEKTRDRVLTERELKLIWKVAGQGDYAGIVQLLILTGQRREEVAAMTWDELNLEDGIWRINRGRTKNSRSHQVPLSEPAVHILKSRQRYDGRNLVFGRSGPFSGWSKCKLSLDGRITAENGSPLQPWRLHDLRRTVATRLADLGVEPHIIESVLNHQTGFRSGVGGVYNRSNYAAEARVALSRWAHYLLELLEEVANNDKSE